MGMTEQEAIDELKCYRACSGTQVPEEIEVAIEALEKEIPYKPETYEDRYYACKCDNILLEKWEVYPTKLMPKSNGLPRCLACGQKLDWGNEDAE